MTFPQFAFNNVKRNTRSYLGYFLSCAFSVMILFIFLSFSNHPNLVTESSMRQLIGYGMGASAYITYAFSFLFIFYSISNFLQARKKEFGILTILGISNSQLKWLIFYENMLIGLSAIITGIAVGLLLLKGLFMGVTKVVDMKELPFYLPLKAIGITGGAFLILFLVVASLTPFMLRQTKVLHLIHGTRKPKKEPKASIFLVLLSIGCLSYVYHFLLSKGFLKISSFTDILILLLILGLGTYFFFSQFSVYLLRWLKKRKLFYWKGTRMLWLSDLVYQMKNNTRLFFLVTVTLSVAFSAISGFLVLDQNAKKMLSSPFSYAVYDWETKNTMKRNKIVGQVESELNQARVKYEKMTLHLLDKTKSKGQMLHFMKFSEYHQYMKKLNKEVKNLESEETLVLNPGKDSQVAPPALTLIKFEDLNLHLKSIGELSDNIYPRWRTTVYVVSDATYQVLLKKAQKKDEHVQVGFIIPAWIDGIPKTDSLETKLGDKITQSFLTQYNQEANFLFYARGVEYNQYKLIFNMGMFIGLFLAALFVLATSGVLYFRLYTQLEQDEQQYHSLSKIGLTESELKRSVTIQMALLFFLPFLIAIIHTTVGLKALSKLMVNAPIAEPAIFGMGSFLLLQMIYFAIVRNSYLHRLKRFIV